MGWIRRYKIAKFGVDDAAFSEPIPSPKQNLWRQLFTYLALSVRWPGAARAALALGIPGLIALLLGFENEMLLIATGAYAVISGEGHPFRYRWKPMAIIGVLLVAGVTMGSFIGQEVQELVSETGNTWWISITVIFSSIVAAILVFGANSLRMTAPGIFFIVMVTSSSQMSSGLGLMPWQVGMWATVGAVSAWILGMLPALIDPHAPERQAVENLEKAVEKYEKSPSYAVQERHDASSALNTAWVALDDAGIISGGRVIRKSQSDLVARALTAQNRLAALNQDVTGGDGVREPLPHRPEPRGYPAQESHRPVHELSVNPPILTLDTDGTEGLLGLNPVRNDLHSLWPGPAGLGNRQRCSCSPVGPRKGPRIRPRPPPPPRLNYQPRYLRPRLYHPASCLASPSRFW